MQASFYQLTQTPMDKVLPKLLEKILSSRLRAVALFDTDERCAYYNHLLWTYSSRSFLPHGMQGDPNPMDHPLWLTTTQENPNNAQVMLVTEGSQVSHEWGYSRCIDLYDGHDPDRISQAHGRWQSYEKQGVSLACWGQDTKGSWVKMTHPKN